MTTDRNYTVDEVITAAQHIHFEKGDILAIMTDAVLTLSQAEQIKASAKAHGVPDGVEVWILGSGAKIAKVTFAEDE